MFNKKIFVSPSRKQTLYSTLIEEKEKYTFYMSVKAEKEEISEGEAEN